MKQYIVWMLASALIFGGCSDFLDRDPLSQASENTFWQTEADALAGVNALYPLLPDSRDFWRDCQSDNSLMTNAWGESGLGYICQGAHNAATGYLAEEWKYDHIRRILYFLERLEGMHIDAAKKKRFEGEARFILALRYYRMTRHFGDIPLIKEKPVDLDEAALPRSPKQEVLDYAVENINKAIEYLPDSYAGDDIGRITKGAALTLKADMYLDMASYAQFHRGQEATDLWKEAAGAAKSVIDLNLYDLENDFASLFKSPANNNNKEVILAYQYKEDEITHMLPILASPAGTGITGQGWASFCPTRQLIDSYEMTDGKTIYESDLYDKNNPWENRDARLKKTFFLPGYACLRPDGSYEPYMPHPAYNKNERINHEGGGITGYMYLKYNDQELVKPDASWANFSLYRYAEVLLIYAEALNEYEPGNTQIAWAVNRVRKRAGLPGVDRLVGNQEAMREKIREERRHEFVAEHKRYFDILRWKTAEKVLNEPGYGINKDENAPIGDYTQEQFLGQNRSFDANKHYLWPIPQSARDKNPNLTQNPNW
ncbi:MAG: RagB/SusD family nutrient uptake outer membrane protein [Parabacteroides sp.]|nr:RagB/SusD family nutrient uptake outer membrane protein [Parabacteroides sp.]